MIAEVRGAFTLAAVLAFFFIVIAVLALGALMKPGRWIERPRIAG